LAITVTLRSVLGKLHRLGCRELGGGLTDAELLRRYRESRDEAAFETLVWRHGVMVLAVCRRTTRSEPDAEDAFQATFLTLAPSAAAITRQESVGGWLYRVAGRVARRLRARAARQAASPLPEVLEPTAGPDEGLLWRDLRPVLDEEVGRLPARYRVPFVLCYLEGRTTTEAARELCWPRGTVATRLAHARRRLRAHLTRRGVVLSAGVLAATLTREVSATPAPAPLVRHFARAALAFAENVAVATPLAMTRVLTLTEGELRTMFLTKLRVFATVLLVAAIAVLTLSFLAGTLLAETLVARLPARQAVQAPPVPPAPAPQAGGRLLFYRLGHLSHIAPDGKGERGISKDRGKFLPGLHRLSPDSKRIAFLVQVEENPPPGQDPRRKVYVRSLDGAEPGIDLDVEAQVISWSPKGRQLAVTDVLVGDDGKTPKFVSWLVDVKTRRKTPLKVPDNQMITDWSSDGKYFLTTEFDDSKKEPASRLHLMRKDGAEDKVLTAAGRQAEGGRLSPDGRRVLYEAPDPQRPMKDNEPGYGLFVLDIQQGKVTRVEGQPLNGDFMGYCWSPDGRRIAYAWRQNDTPPNQRTESHLVVADPDDRHATTIASEQGEFSGIITISEPDLR
jgi:RNA polymerase sigma factor (sigma-70 family)